MCFLSDNLVWHRKKILIHHFLNNIKIITLKWCNIKFDSISDWSFKCTYKDMFVLCL